MSRYATPFPSLPNGLWPFLRHYLGIHGRLYLTALLLSTLAAICSTLLPWALGRIIRQVTQASRPEAVALHGALGVFLSLCLIELLCSRGSDWLQMNARVTIRQQVIRDLFHYVQHHDHRYLTDHFAGHLAHRITEMGQAMFQVLFMALMDFWPMVIVLGLSLYLLAMAHALLAWGYLVWVGLFILLSARLSRQARRHFASAAAARSRTSGFIIDAMTNLINTKLFAREPHERQRLQACQGEERRVILQANRYNQRIRWFQFGAASLLKGGTLWLALALWQHQQIDLANFVMVTSLTFPIINETRNLGRRLLDFSEHLGTLDSGVAELLVPHGMADTPDTKQPAQVLGHLRFVGVQFGYQPDQPVIPSLDLDIPPGQKVGIVGRSGAGKSTLLALLLRLYDPQQGSIRLDEQDLRDWPQADLRQQFAIIPQEPLLFHRSIADNLRFGRLTATDEELRSAARAAHAHDFIQQLPQGYDTLVGERGIKLSGGQRQRLTIARALLRPSPILILDEATSSLDTLTEQTIQQTLRELPAHRTLLVIAHRLSTVAHLERILVFQAGRLVEEGTHDALLALGGEYARLWQLQTGGQDEAEAAAHHRGGPDLHLIAR